MSLKALARERLALIRAAETAGETCFIGSSRTDALMKHGEPHETAENGSCFNVSPPIERNAETSRKQLLVEDGLRRLARMPPPRLRSPQVWGEVRSDALRLANEGWVEKALSLGWDPLHLFGCSPERGGNSDQEGLAVKLAGRTLLMLDRTSAVIRDGPGAYAYFNLRPMTGAVLLWDLALGAHG